MIACRAGRRVVACRKRLGGGWVPAALLLVPLAAGVPARAEVVVRAMQVEAEFTEAYGPAERVKTSPDARLQLYAETAEECRRLEAMSNLACRVESLALRLGERSGRPALLGSVRFVLEPRGSEGAKAATQDGDPSRAQPGDPR